VTDSRRVWARRAGWLAAAGIFLAANVGFFLWYRGTARERKAALESRKAALEREVDSREAEAKKLARDRARLTEVRAALDEFYGHRIGGERDTLAGVVDEVHAILKKVGVSPGQIGYAPAPVDNPGLTQMVVSFGFKGEYSRFKQLLDAFQSSRRWLAVREVGLSGDTDVPGTVQVRITVVTYFLTGQRETSPRARLAGSVSR
jgi:Tfp pilus assembly protein PilO